MNKVPEVILKGLGFEPSKKPDDKKDGIWINKYPCSYGTEGIFEIYRSYDLGTIVNTIFEAGRKTGRLHIKEELKKFLN